MSTARPEPHPDFLRHARRTALDTPRWLWPLNALLAISLLAAGSYAGRAQLGAHASTRPLALAACQVLGCKVPAWSEPAAIHVLDHTMQSDPNRRDVLQVSAALRNEAAFAQAWPVLDISLADVNGNLVARGQFAPAHYLHPGAPADMPRMQPLDVAIAVIDPSRKAVSFELQLLAAPSMQSDNQRGRLSVR